jgi:putative ABC transport system permease protein
MDHIVQEVRFALRALRRSPAFAATAVLILGLGIGMAVAMFAVSNAVLVRPLPVQEQERIVLPRTVDARGVDLAWSAKDLDQLRLHSRTLATIAGEAHQGAFELTLLDGDRSLVLKAAWVTGNFFDVLGVRPALGRLFHADEESSTDPSVLVISYDTWQRRFAGDSGVLGRRLTNPYTQRRYAIVGVAPAGLDYPVGVEYWSPTVYGGGLDMIGRLAPHATVGAARAEFLSIMQDLDRRRPAGEVSALAGAQIRTFPQAVLGDVRPVLRALTAAVILLLLLACVNVGNLVLLRVAARGHEMALRRSLGAATWDIVRSLLLESGSLAVAGGALGFALAVALIRLLVRVAPAGLPRIDVIRLGGAPLLVAVGVTLVTVALVGILPALTALRGDLATPLRVDARSGSETRTGRRVRHGFVVSQVALALVMLAGAGLLARSLEELLRIDLGYNADHVSLLWLAIPVTQSDADAKFAALLDQVPPALRALPGVTALTPIAAPPFFGSQIFNAPWEVAGRAAQAGYPRIPIEAGGAEYFVVLGIPLLRGRGFLGTDRAATPKVAVVSEGAARLLQLGPDPIGERIRFAGDTGAGDWRTVVGVTGDVHYRSLREATPAIYLPSRQFFFQGGLAVRTSGPLATLLPAMRRAVHDADPAASIVRSETMDDLLTGQRALPRLSTLLFSGFGLVALLLAVIGLYGLVASVVRDRTRDFGVRMALGATPARVCREVIGGALSVLAAGAAVGLAGALLSSRLLTALLFQVSPTDPLALAAVSALLLGVGLVAAYVPARRATRIDPAQALRAE